MTKDVRFYNVLFPFWMLLLFPQFWLIVLPGNFLIDSAVLLISLALMKIGEKKLWYKRYIWKIFACGLAADVIGAAYMLVMMLGFGVGAMGDEWYLTLPALVIAAVMIFVLDYAVAFRRADAPVRWKLALIFAVVTAPYTNLVPSAWLY